NGLDGDIQNVFNEILYEFMAVPEINVFETSSEIEEKIEQWLDVNNTDGHLRILSNPLDVKDLLKLVDHNNKKNVLKY
ncbi:hypothetical protein R1W55_19165, partial [Acinetobacter baumannii]|nr:hypothetical protein [Acinetobacter baumannii]